MFIFQKLFKNKAVRDMESKLRFRRGKTRIQNYVQEARRSSERYHHLARDAYRLGDVEQFRMIGSHYLRLRNTITRWERFLVKLEALELRRNEVVATKDFLQSIDALTLSINRGVSPQEISRMQDEIERAIEKSQAQEEMLDIAMEAAGSSLLEDAPHQREMLAELETGFGSRSTSRQPEPPATASSRPPLSALPAVPPDKDEQLDREIETALRELETSFRPRSG